MLAEDNSLLRMMQKPVWNHNRIHSVSSTLLLPFRRGVATEWVILTEYPPMSHLQATCVITRLPCLMQSIGDHQKRGWKNVNPNSKKGVVPSEVGRFGSILTWSDRYIYSKKNLDIGHLISDGLFQVIQNELYLKVVIIFKAFLYLNIPWSQGADLGFSRGGGGGWGGIESCGGEGVQKISHMVICWISYLYLSFIDSLYQIL